MSQPSWPGGRSSGEKQKCGNETNCFYTYLQFMIARFDRPFLQLSLPLYLHLNHNRNDFAFLYSFMATVHHCGTLNTLTEGTNLLQFAFWNYPVIRSKYMLKVA